MVNEAYDSLETVISSMMYAMQGNDDFLKLMTNDKRNALDITPLKNYEDLIGNRIFPMETLSTPQTEQKSIVAVEHLNTRKSTGGSDAIYSVTFTVDVYCHIDMWLLNGGKIRPLRLKTIVINSILGLDIPSLNSKANFVSDDKMYYDQQYNFKGYRLTFSWESTSGWLGNV